MPGCRIIPDLIRDRHDGLAGIEKGRAGRRRCALRKGTRTFSRKSTCPLVVAADLYGATRVVAEKNQGGNLIESNLRAVDANLPVKLVHAGPSKATRAEPIALRFETGRARLAGHFPELEDQLCALTWSGYQGPGSPDRADAMVWAMTELFKKERAAPRIRLLCIPPKACSGRGTARSAVEGRPVTCHSAHQLRD